MPLKVQCKHCNSRISVRDELAGKQVKCPKCGQAIRIPPAASAASPPKLKERPQPEPDPEPVPPTDEFSSFDDDEHLQDTNDDDSEFVDDPYGDTAPARKIPPTRKSSGKAARNDSGAESLPTSNNGFAKKSWMLAAACAAGGLLGGLLIGAFVFPDSSDEVTAKETGPGSENNPSGPESTASTTGSTAAVTPNSDAVPTPTPGTLPAPRPELTADQLAEAADIRRVLEKMRELITAQDDREFLIQFGPIDELRRLQTAEAAGQALPEIPRNDLLRVIQAVSGEIADVGKSAMVASIRVETNDSGDPQWAPGPGYEGDVSAAIAKSITELEQGRIREFMLNMFPPDALRAMFRNGPERSLAAKADKDSALVVRMLQDLKSLAAEQPQITGDVAEFSLPAVEYTEADLPKIRPALAQYPVPDRIIRFSKINGHWRFYDDGSLRQTGALDGNVIQLNLERVGTSWRLVKYPRI